MENSEEQLYNLASSVIKILQKKTFKGSKHKSWKGFQNGLGEEVGDEIDKLILEAKNIIKQQKI